MKLEFLGQFSFQATQPILPRFIPFPGPDLLRPQAQATRFQAPVTTNVSDAYVVVFIRLPGRLNPSPGQFSFARPLLADAQGWVKRGNFDATINWLKSQGGYSLSPQPNNVFFLNVTRAQFPEVIRRLGLAQNYLFPGSRSGQMVSGPEEGKLGQDESVPGISIECEKCELWEKQAGSVATGCACEPDPIRIGAAAVVVGGIIWYLMR
jgi:hypothetical protein